MLHKRVKGILKQVLKCMFLFGLIVILEANQAAAVNTSVTAKKNTTTPKTVTCEKTVIKVTLDGAYTGAKKQGSDPSWLTTTGSGSSYTVTVNALGSASARSTTITFLETRGSETIHWYLKIEQKNHNWGDTWVTDEAATCSKTGSKHRVCNACGRRETGTIPKDSSNHAAWGSWKVTKAATCTATGTKKRTCGCGNKTETQTIPVDSSNHGNNGTKTKTVNATCTKDGYTVTVCKGCGAERGSRTKIPAPGHTWGSWTTDTEPGCETPGTKHRNCTECNEREDGTIKALEHLYEGKVKTVPATCTTDGYSVVQCSRCGKEEGTKTVIKAGHKWGTWNIIDDAGCETPGTKYRTCTRCNAREDGKIDPKGHLVEGQRITVDATCTKEGYWVAKCSRCGAPQGQKTIIPAKGHAWEVWVTDTPAGCETEGKKHRVCSRCKKTETEIITPKGHVFEGQLKTVPAGCTKEGYTVVKCTNCDKEAEGRTILPALGHDWSEWVFNHDETCYEDGTKYRTCGRCDKMEEGTVPKKQHKENSQPKVVPATCVSDGYRVFTCIHCGKEMTERTILKKTGIHNMGEWITLKEATCEEYGEKYRKCANCTHMDYVTLPKLEHLVLGQRRIVVPPDGGVGVMTLVCSRCGKPMGNDAIFDVPNPTNAPEVKIRFVIRDNKDNETVEGPKEIVGVYGQKIGDVFPKVKNPKKSRISAWSDGQGNYYDQYTVISSKEPITLYPSWVEMEKYTIYLHGNGSKKEVMLSYTVAKDEPFELPKAKKLFEGEKGFDRWGTAPDGGNRVFEDNQTVTNIAVKEGGIHLYALWKTATVTYCDLLRGKETSEELTHVYKTKGLDDFPELVIGGLNFVGWETYGGMNKYGANAEYAFEGKDVKLYPRYEVPEYEAGKRAVVFYNPKRNGRAFSIEYISMLGAEVTMPSEFVSFDTQHIFDGWVYHKDYKPTSAPASTKYEAGKKVIIPQDKHKNLIIFVATWKRVPADLTLDYGYNNRIETVRVEVDDYVLPQPERNGYTFLGWRVNPDDPETTVGGTYNVPEKGGKLYAKWEENTYTIEYCDGITGEPLGLSVKVTAKDMIAANTPHIPGMTFSGWTDSRIFPYEPQEVNAIANRTSKKGIKLYNQGASVSEIPLVRPTIKLYSLYKLDKVVVGQTAVVYHPGRGGFYKTPYYYAQAAAIGLPSSKIAVKGGPLDSWDVYTNRWEWGYGHKPGATYLVTVSSGEAGLVVLVPRWKANNKITLDPNHPGAKVVDLTCILSTNEVVRTADLKPYAGDYPGYTLVGWEAIQKNLCKPYGLDDEIYIPNEEFKLVALWRKDKYSVYYHSGFNDNIGVYTEVCERTALSFDEGLFSWLKKPGYEFIGWTLNKPNCNPWEVPESEIIKPQNNPVRELTEDLHVYSCYKEVPLEASRDHVLISYNWMGGTEGPKDEYINPNTEEFHISEVVPKKSGYSFAGWTIAGGEEYILNDSEIQRCIKGLTAVYVLELYAVWKQKYSNPMKAPYQCKYGTDVMPDYYFWQEYESTEWEKINDYCYFAIKTKKINHSEYYQEFDSTILIIEYKDGKWELSGRSASTNWKKHIEYYILTKNKDADGRALKFAVDGGIELLEEHPVFKYFVMAWDLESLEKELNKSLKEGKLSAKTVDKIFSKIAKGLYSFCVEELKMDETLASETIIELGPSLRKAISSAVSDNRTILLETFNALLKAYTFKVEHHQEIEDVLFKILTEADEKMNKKVMDRIYTSLNMSQMTDWDGVKSKLDKIGTGLGIATKVFSTILENVDYQKSIDKGMDPFGEMNLALKTFYDQLEGLEFSSEIKGSFTSVVRKIYDAYCKLK